MAYEPAELTLKYRLTNDNTASGYTAGAQISSDALDLFFIDIAKDLSMLNRRLYKQGMVYYIQEVVLYNNNSAASPDAGEFKFNTLPNTWTTHNAWKKSKALWDKHNRQVLNDSPSLKSKWHDFKVLMNNHHHVAALVGSPATLAEANAAGYANSDLLLPETAHSAAGDADIGVRIKPGEWAYSRYTFPESANLDLDSNAGANGSSTYIHMLGPEFISSPEQAVGAVEGYQHTRATVQAEPATDADAHTSWMIGLFDDGENLEDIVDILEDANDNPPYDLDEYIGSSSNGAEGFTQQVLVSGAGAGVRMRAPGFAAPCGLICLQTRNADSDSDYEIYVKLAPGSYRGVAAVPMGQ